MVRKLCFDVRDWLSDTTVRACTLEARALWFDMLCLMHQARPTRGCLTHPTGEPIGADELAKIVGVSPDVCRELLAELRHAGVYSVDAGGVLYNRRMVRERQPADPPTLNRATRLRHPSGQHVPPLLEAYVEMWARLKRDKLVTSTARINAEVWTAWQTVEKSAELQELLADPEGIEALIRRSTFCHGKPWFKLHRLLCGRNKQQTLIVQELIDGRYVDQERAPEIDVASAWLMAQSVARQMSTYDPDGHRRRVLALPHDVRAVAESIGWKSICDGNRDLVRSHFIKLWEDRRRRTERRGA